MTITSRRLARRFRERVMATGTDLTQFPTTAEPADADPTARPETATEAPQEKVDAAK
jgi:hypothetical protein